VSDKIAPRPARGRRRLFQPGSRAIRRAGGGAAERGDARRGDFARDEPSPPSVFRAMNAIIRRDGSDPQQGNLPAILTAGDDVEDEDEDIGDAEAIDDCDP
jgi:hypothetical protein